MRWVSILTAFLAVLPAVLPIAKAEDAAVEELKDHLERKAPRHWQVHVRWRDHTLLASFMPPYQEAFDLWYQPESLLQTMRELCPPRGTRIWDILTEDQDVLLEPTVGGKTTLEMRVSCRKQLLPH
jgi:hypothetical protein